MVFETNLPFARIRSVLLAFALSNGGPLKLAEVQRKTRVSTPTLRKLLTAFEALFLLRVQPSEGGRSAPIVWFEDLGEWSRLTGQAASLDHFVFSQVRLPFAYLAGQRAEFFQYRTRGGALVPVCLRADRGTAGFIPLNDSDPSRSQILSAESFLKRYADSKVIFVHPERDWRRISDRILVAPISAF